MRRKLLHALLWLLPCYFAGLFAGLWLIPLIGGNRHDSSVEAAMTAIFVTGPLTAIVGVLISLLVVRGARAQADR